MAPTSQMDTSSQSSTAEYRQSGGKQNDHFLPMLNINDTYDISGSFDNSCEIYFSSRDISPSPRSVIPEASAAFRRVLGNMRAENRDESNTKKTLLSPSLSSQSSPIRCSRVLSSSSEDRNETLSPRASSSSPTSSSSSSSANSSLSSSSSSLSPLNAVDSPAVATLNKQDSRRPASFGGTDAVILRTRRRASHCEKRVSWADDLGSDHQLISVRLIRPRLSVDTNMKTNISPIQSILRYTGSN